jgi:ABC-type amino acid transport substrate-binding protein
LETEQAVREQIECVLTKMKFKPRIESKPWKRIYHDLQRGHVDGFFSSIPHKHLNGYAEISVPLVLENWYWFWRPGINAPESWQEGYKLGSILGSQQAKWLEEAGYQVSMTANHLPQLIKMLNTGRIDVILVDREHFFQAINQSAKSNVNYESRFFRYMPLGAYFSDGFLKKYPDFMALFNQEVTRCPHQSFQLSENEKKGLSK